jgi:hypothetical protein
MGLSVFGSTFSTFYSHYKVTDSSIEMDDFFNYILCWILWCISYLAIIIILALIVLEMVDSINNNELCEDIWEGVNNFCRFWFEYVCYTAFDMDVSDGMISYDGLDIESHSSVDRPQKIQSYLDKNTTIFQDALTDCPICFEIFKKTDTIL